MVAGSATALTCGLGEPGAPLTCGPGPRPTSGPSPRTASGLGPRTASWAGVASDFRSGPPSTSTSGPPLGSEGGGASLRLDGPPSPGRGSAFVPTSGKRSTGGATWRSGSRAGSLWVGRPGSVAARGGPFVARGGPFSASRPGTSVEPDGGEGGGGWRSPTGFGGSAERPGLASPSRGAGGASGPGRSPEGWRAGAATAGSVGGCATNGPATGVEGAGGVEPPLSPGSASSCVSDPGGSGGSG